MVAHALSILNPEPQWKWEGNMTAWQGQQQIVAKGLDYGLDRCMGSNPSSDSSIMT